MEYKIHPNTTIGTVSLTVRDLNRSLAFYQDVIGFRLHRKVDHRAYLGTGASDLLELYEHANAPHISGTTGLYHFAVLMPTRSDLAYALKRIIDTKTQVQGFADHLVSEAIYLSDPDGNGIEIYCDRPRQNWPRHNGELQMATDPLDLESLLSELRDQPEVQTAPSLNTMIGHIHLHVRDILEAETFYRDILGFDLVQRYGSSASFLSAGGYHHHIGVNTWAGRGAPPPPDGSVGLRWYQLRLPNREALARTIDHLSEAKVRLAEYDSDILLRDPSQNGILLTVT